MTNDEQLQSPAVRVSQVCECKTQRIFPIFVQLWEQIWNVPDSSKSIAILYPPSRSQRQRKKKAKGPSAGSWAISTGSSEYCVNLQKAFLSLTVDFLQVNAWVSSPLPSLPATIPMSRLKKKKYLNRSYGWNLWWSERRNHLIKNTACWLVFLYNKRKNVVMYRAPRFWLYDSCSWLTTRFDMNFRRTCGPVPGIPIQLDQR
jgi:hypothetical protein